MGLFSRKSLLGPVFNGYTDFHCHILPGVDDGVQSLESSLAILEKYGKAGVSQVWLTPHVMEDCPNTPEDLKSRFEKLCMAVSEAGFKAPQMHLAAEHMMDGLFDERLAKGEVLPHADRCLLVETSYYNPPIDLYGTLQRVLSAGYYPMLAHPERYLYMDDSDYERIRSMRVRFQLNLSSLAGFYGVDVCRKAERLLKLGYYDCSGTDLHRESTLQRYFDAKIADKLLDRVIHLRSK